MNTHRGPFILFRYLSLISILFANATGEVAAKQSQHLQDKQPAFQFPFKSGIEDSLLRNSFNARLSAIDIKSTNAQRVDSDPCNTSTFYMNLKVPAGQKIMLNEIKTQPTGNYFASGNIGLPSGETEGLLISMNNAGAILQQNKLRVNNSSTKIYDSKVMWTGKIVVTGSINDGNNSVFVSVLNSNLSFDWVQVYSMPSSSVKMTVSVFDTSHIAWATQLADGSIHYSELTGNGITTWDKKVYPQGLESLVGFDLISWGRLGLITNCIRNNKRVVELMELFKGTGQYVSTHTIGNGSTENKFLETTSFSGRQMSVGVEKSLSGQFRIVRNIMYGSSNIETEHAYSLPGNIDFNTTGAMDYVADAMGLCLPQDGKLIFIRHFSYYQTSPDRIRQYSVPVGSSISAVTRSVDGGFLFGLGSGDSSSLVFIKTDSIGLLPGCGYTDVPINYSETFNKQNTASLSNDISSVRSWNTGMVSLGPSTLTGHFACNVIYCPPPPTIDTCLDTYFKTMRTNSYVDMFSSYFLMRNNNHLGVTTRVDRFLNEMHRLTYGIKLFDETGKFIKGMDVYVDGLSSYLHARQMTDSSIMLVSRTPKNGIVYFTFTHVSDDLQILWSKTIRTYNDFSYYTGGVGLADLHRDTEGNFYMVSTSMEFFNIPAKVLVYKMDRDGNQVWLKAYQLPGGGTFGNARAISNATSIVVLIESGNGAVNVQLDKNTGQMLSAFKHQITSAGAIYNRFVKYENQKIYYAGNHTNGSFTMAVFDSIGRPLRIRILNSGGSNRGIAFKSGNLYGVFDYFNGSAYRNVLFKTDSDLNLLFVNEFMPMRTGHPIGMDVSDNGSIYLGGNISYGGVNGSYNDPYIVKYNSKGELGTCGFVPISLPFVDLTPTYSQLPYSSIPVNVTPDFLPVHFLPDGMGQKVSAILCSSTQPCDTIYLDGPVSVCRLNEGFVFKSIKTPGCTLQPTWIYDTTYARVQILTDTAATFQFKRTGNTWLRVKLNTGCKIYEDSLFIKISASPFLYSIGRDSTFCPGDTVVLNAGNGFNSYIWQDGSTDSLYYATMPGKYYVQTTNGCGDQYNDTINLSMATIPILHIGSDTSICKKDTLQISASSGFSNYLWKPSAYIIGQGQHIKVSPTQPTTITLDARTLQGCHAFDTMTLTIKEARPVSVGNDTSFCKGQLVALSLNNNNYTQIIWSTGSVNNTITVSQPGSYWVNVIDTNNCAASDTMIVQSVYPLPKVDLGNDFDLCYGENRRMDAGNFNQYNWQDGSSQRYFTINTPGSYWVSVKDNNGCAGSDTVKALNIKPVPSNFLMAVDSICQYATLQLKPNRSFQSYHWSTGSVQTSTSVASPGLYILRVKDVNGCEGSDTIRVVQKNCYSGVIIPSAFTPNGDQLNDVFKAMVFGSVIKFNLQVYNRNGELVFKSDNPSQGWNGVFKGMIQPNAVFIWQCSYQLEGGPPTYEKGFVTLIR